MGTGVGGAGTGEMVSGREGGKVGAGGKDCPAGVGRTSVGEGVAGRGESVRSGSGGSVGVGGRDGGGEVRNAGAGEVVPAEFGGAWRRWRLRQGRNILDTMQRKKPGDYVR